MAHLTLGLGDDLKPESSYEMVKREYDPKVHVLAFTMITFFFYGLFYPLKRLYGSSVVHMVVVMINAFVGYLIVPGNLGLAYVSTSVTLFQAIGALLDKEPTKEYLAASVIIGLPVSAAIWVEALMCDSFLVQFGGHLWYDLTIPISMMIYLIYVKNTSETAGPFKVKAD